MSEEVPFFSIIMPAYNKAPYIERTIAKVFDQSFKSWEVIMIGGESEDNTNCICEDYAQRFTDKFTFFKQTKTGVSNARNEGILASRGKYIAFLDADDIWMSEYLMYMYQLICDFPDAIFYCGGQSWLYPDGFETNRIMPCERGYIDYFQTSMDYDGLGIITSWIVYEKNAVIDVGLFKEDFVIGEDADLATRMALKGKVAYEPKKCGTYLAELPNSLCKYSRGFIVHVPAEEELLAVPQTPKIIEYRERWILSTVLQNLDRGNKEAARAELDRIKNRYLRRKTILTILLRFPTSICLWLHNMYNKYIWRYKWEGDKE